MPEAREGGFLSETVELFRIDRGERMPGADTGEERDPRGEQPDGVDPETGTEPPAMMEEL